MIQRLAKIFSAMFSPMIMPTFGVFLTLWITILNYNSLGVRLIVLTIMFAITCLLPIVFIYFLLFFGVLKDKNLVSKEERLLPYVGFIVSFFLSLIYLNSVNAPIWMLSTMYGVILATIIAFAVNSLVKWKISAHMTGIGGIIGMVYMYQTCHLATFDLFWLFCFFVLAAGVLGSARIVLERHTPLQVLAGFANGLISVVVIMKILI